MQRKLNADLFWENRSQKPCFQHGEHWVFLRTLPKGGDCKADAIGPMEIEEIPEAEAERNALKRQIRETEHKLRELALKELGLSAHPDIEPAADPHIILTRDCFGFKGAVRLLIYSDKPFV